MPQLLQTPPNSLDRVHRRLTTMMQAQYATEDPIAPVGNQAEAVAALIELLDDSIETTRAFVVDIQSVVSNVTGVRGPRPKEVLPPKNVEALYRIARRAQPIIAVFDAKLVSAVNISSIEARMSEWKTLLDTIPPLKDEVTAPPVQGQPHTDLANVRKTIENVLVVVNNQYTTLETKLVTTSRFVGAGWAASNAF
jgi:hypothetical protein